jgi:hypothetical protein
VPATESARAPNVGTGLTADVAIGTGEETVGVDPDVFSTRPGPGPGSPVMVQRDVCPASTKALRGLAPALVRLNSSGIRCRSANLCSLPKVEPPSTL